MVKFSCVLWPVDLTVSTLRRVLFPQSGCTPLHYAAAAGDESCISALIAAGAEKAPRDKDGSTPLHYAAVNGKYKAVRDLLRRNVKVNSEDRDKWTPLHCAAYKGTYAARCPRALAVCDVTLRSNVN